MHLQHSPWKWFGVALGAAMAWGETPLPAQSDTPPIIQARRFSLRVRVTSDSLEPAALALWYTRDRGTTWQRGPRAADDADSIVFEAPGEGLYGFYVVATGPTGGVTPEPKSGTPPQRWAYVDYTPPLAQWKDVELLADANGARRIAMTWAAYDANLDSRPVAISYQPAGQMYWTSVNPALPNTGQYDWLPPAGLRGRVTFKLTVRDLGGHAVERLFGPISLDEPRIVKAEAPATRPAARELVQASPVASRPADLPGPVDPVRRKEAQRLCAQGDWHRERGQYPEAQERYLEALQQDPTLLTARVNLAGVLYSRGRFAEAVRHYQEALQTDPDRPTALRGLALAYVARREYASARKALERLLARDEKNAEGWLDLGDVSHQMGRREEAREQWTRAATVDPGAGAVVLQARNRLSLFAAGSAANAPPEGR